MFEVRVWATVVALAVLLGAGAAVGAAHEVTLTVTVVDQDGDPVSGVDLSATWDGGGPVNETTRANGQALIDVAHGADVEITVHDGQYVRNHPFVVENATTQEVEIPVSLSGTATVEVVDDDGPVPRAIVQLYRDGRYVANTRADDSGTFTSEPLERGVYTLTVYREGYLRNRTTLTIDRTVEQRMTIEESSTLVSVNVTDDHHSPPRAVPNATVSLGSLGSVRTLSNGEATIRAPVNRQYDVTVSKDGYDSTTRSISVRESATGVDISIQRTPAITVTPSNQRVVIGETVRVTVTDEYEDPVSGATVSIDGEAVGETDEDGEVDVPIDDAGEHTIGASVSGLSDEATVEGVDPDADDATTPTETEPTETNATIEDDGDGVAGPGFTPAIAVLAVALVALLARRRARSGR